MFYCLSQRNSMAVAASLIELEAQGALPPAGINPPWAPGLLLPWLWDCSSLGQ